MDGPAMFCVLIPDGYMDNKVKDSNKCTRFESIDWFLANMHPPKNGAVFSLYSYESADDDLQNRYSASCIWPFNEKYRWVGGGDYITLQRVEQSIAEKPHGRSQHYGNGGTAVHNISKLTDYDVKLIDYTMSEDEMFSLMKYSRLHITYHGASYFTAAASGIPTLCYGTKWGDTGGHLINTATHITIPGTAWNQHIGTRPTKLHQFDWESQSVYQGPQSYVHHLQNDHELMEFLNGAPVQYYRGDYRITD
jgi:hypothetical protein